MLESRWGDHVDTVHKNRWWQINSQFCQQFEVLPAGHMIIRWIDDWWWCQIEECDGRFIGTLLNDLVDATMPINRQKLFTCIRRTKKRFNKVFHYPCIYSFDRFLSSSEMLAWLPSLFSVNNRIIDPNSSFCDHSGIWLIDAFIRSFFRSSFSFSWAGRSNDDDDVFTLKLLFWLNTKVHGQRLDKVLYNWTVDSDNWHVKFIRKQTHLWRLELFDSHKKTRTSNFFHFGSILMMQANCSINSDTTSNGLLLVGSNTFIGHTSM